MTHPDDEPTGEMCPKCRKPILPGEARNGLSGSHWDCDPHKSPRKIMAELDAAYDDIRRSAERLAGLYKRKL